MEGCVSNTKSGCMHLVKVEMIEEAFEKLNISSPLASRHAETGLLIHSAAAPHLIFLAKSATIEHLSHYQQIQRGHKSNTKAFYVVIFCFKQTEPSFPLQVC